ncbi:MAG: DUF3459 domain-containing protein, partial [Erythrobacter sp.]|nr:DUF3459 domain-containing protein [Erythrobacter sp.]
FYLPLFTKKLPDLNWENPQVRQAVYNLMIWWLDRGVDGFRIDALNFAMHDPQFRDNPPAPANGKARTRPFDFQLKVHNQSHPDIPAFIARIRALTDEYEGIFTVAEVGGDEALGEMRAFTADETHLNSAYGFDFLYADKLTPGLVCGALAQWPDEAGLGWPSWAFENHDAPRALSRWCAPADRAAFARMKMLLLMALRGNVILYYGEELGLTQVDIPFEQVQDPEAIANWPLTLSRDGARTPMPWQPSTCGGFGSDSPWLPMGDENRLKAVAAQQDDPQSLLNHTRTMLALRRAHPALRLGAVSRCDVRGQMLVLGRRSDSECVRAFVNLGAEPVVLTPGEADGDVLCSVNGATADGLPPFGALVVLA